MGSPRFKLSKTDIVKVLKGGVIAALGVVIAWMATSAIPILEAGGSWDAVIASAEGLDKASLAAFFAVLVNAVRKFLSNTIAPPAD